MKRTLLFFCFLSCVLHSVSFAQNIPIDSFYTPGTTWTVDVSYEYDETYHAVPFHAEQKTVFKIENDIFASGIKYHQLSVSNFGGYKTCGSSSAPIFDSYPNTTDIAGKIRIDSNKVYFTPTAYIYPYVYSLYALDSEYLIYDFNLKSDSSFFIPYATSASHVTSIDSVTLSNGTYIKRYSFDTSPQWLQGIGSVTGLMEYISLIGGSGIYNWHGSSMLCYDNPSFSYHFQYPTEILYGDLQYNCFDVTTLSTNNLHPTNQRYKCFPKPN